MGQNNDSLYTESDLESLRRKIISNFDKSVEEIRDNSRKRRVYHKNKTSNKRPKDGESSDDSDDNDNNVSIKRFPKTMSSLFPVQTPGAQTSGQYLVQFRAGKMIRTGTTVSPVKDRKGLVYLYQSDDALIHFCWKDRETGQLEDDLTLFPEEAVFEKVVQCTTGRVFVLKFLFNDRRYFYWSQEPNAAKDDELVAKFNEYIRSPPLPRAIAGGGSRVLSPEDIQTLLGCTTLHYGATNRLEEIVIHPTQADMPLLAGLRDPQFIAALQQRIAQSSDPTAGNSAHGSAQTPHSEATTSTANTSRIELSDLQSAISGLNQSPAVQSADIQMNELSVPVEPQPSPQPSSAPNEQPSGSKPLSAPMEPPSSSGPSLEGLQPLLSDNNFMGRVRRSLRDRSRGQSPADDLSAAIRSRRLGPVVEAFGLGQECVDAANAG
ncbi:unnamed protein product, partial [Medioppia subpectinata]